ncbi:MAG: glycogen synthase GlgA [Kiritimatiellae bacterium]|nr:glycogen synthase GlgA [Kiritimatiellia bacterium]
MRKSRKQRARDTKARIGRVRSRAQARKVEPPPRRGKTVRAPGAAKPAPAPRPPAAARQAAGGLKILFVASECAPFAKVGGLGDVVSALPKVLRRMGHDARICLPLYAMVDRAKYGITFDRSACVHMGNHEEQWVGLHRASHDGDVPVWFVDCERFFGRPGIYDLPGGEYGDNAFRYALLSKAAMQICKDTGFIPDVMHLHDWPTAVVAAFLKTWDRILSPLSDTASVVTIHNIGYQGVYHAGVFPYLGVGWEHFAPDRFEDHGKVNLLKAGVAFADAITTVSPAHAREILTPDGGMGMAPFLNNRRSDLFGILNGADYEHWNPETDPLIPARYSARDLGGKAACKAELQRRMKLDVKPDVPVFGIISRFAPQKGFNLIMEALPRAMNSMVMQVAALGMGDAGTEDFFKWLAAAYPGRAGAFIGYSNELSHLIEAGSDFFLMPSLYEPCGLNQMYSMKYGTLPIVRAIGGLEDTVQNYNEATGEGTGFKFLLPTGAALHDTIGWAVSTWFDRPKDMAKLRRTAMAQDFSWEKSAAEYVKVYAHALRHRRGA